jgi:hypothetical protein
MTSIIENMVPSVAQDIGNRPALESEIRQQTEEVDHV